MSQFRDDLKYMKEGIWITCRYFTEKAWKPADIGVCGEFWNRAPVESKERTWSSESMLVGLLSHSEGSLHLSIIQACEGRPGEQVAMNSWSDDDVKVRQSTRTFQRTGTKGLAGTIPPRHWKHLHDRRGTRILVTRFEAGYIYIIYMDHLFFPSPSMSLKTYFIDM